MSSLHCFFCGGKECKYENWRLWTPDKYAGVNAIDGLYCNWITHSILAMQRPSTRLIKEYDLIKKFQHLNIGSIFNLEEVGEHASCGDGIEASSGFSYLPEVWMDNGILYYNFGWTDMDIPNYEIMMNLVQVMSFALGTGKRIAVHCHAGLGRTGLSIACYLVYGENIRAETAILQVRTKRPLSIQTKKQTEFVFRFEAYLGRLRLVFPGWKNKSQQARDQEESISFTRILDNQRRYLHGIEQRNLRSVPKIVYVIINRLVELCTKSSDDTYNQTQILIDELISFEGIEHIDRKMIAFQVDINEGHWGVIDYETDIKFLTCLLLYWLQSLKESILANSDIDMMEKSKSDFKGVVQQMHRDKFQTINFFLSLFRKLNAISKSTLDRAFERLAFFISAHRNAVTHPYLHWEFVTKMPLISETNATDLKPAASQVVLSTQAAPSVAKLDATNKDEAPAALDTESTPKEDETAPKPAFNTTKEVPLPVSPEKKSPLARMGASNASLQFLGSAARSTAAMANAATMMTKNAIANTLSVTRISDKSQSSPAQGERTKIFAKKVWLKAKDELPPSNLTPLIEFLHFVYQSYKCVDETRAISSETLAYSHDLSPTLNPAEFVSSSSINHRANLATEIPKFHTDTQNENVAGASTIASYIPIQNPAEILNKDVFRGLNEAGKRAEAIISTTVSDAFKSLHSILPTMSRSTQNLEPTNKNSAEAMTSNDTA